MLQASVMHCNGAKDEKSPGSSNVTDKWRKAPPGITLIGKARRIMLIMSIVKIRAESFTVLPTRKGSLKLLIMLPNLAISDHDFYSEKDYRFNKIISRHHPFPSAHLPFYHDQVL